MKFLVIITYALDQPYRVLVNCADVGIITEAQAAVRRALDSAQTHGGGSHKLMRSIEVIPVDREVEG